MPNFKMFRAGLQMRSTTFKVEPYTAYNALNKHENKIHIDYTTTLIGFCKGTIDIIDNVIELSNLVESSECLGFILL